MTSSQNVVMMLVRIIKKIGEHTPAIHPHGAEVNCLFGEDRAWLLAEVFGNQYNHLVVSPRLKWEAAELGYYVYGGVYQDVRGDELIDVGSLTVSVLGVEYHIKFDPSHVSDYLWQQEQEDLFEC
jgi:hypothetical protein